MPDVFGVDPVELRRYVGSLSQVIRVDRFVESEGMARGSRLVRIANGCLEADLLPDRALDIGQLTSGGVPIAWVSPTGRVGGERYEPTGDNWLRTFGGGLLATCGLDTFGPAGVDEGDEFGLHGRIGTTPAEIVRCEATPDGVVVEGIIRQTCVFGENLELHRRIKTASGSTTLSIADTVTNRGFDRQPHMMLYHMNFGWPLIDSTTRLTIPSAAVTARDEDAAAGLDQYCEFQPPTPGFREQVYIHEALPGKPIRIENPTLGLAVEMAVSTDTLKYVHQWKMAGQGHYVLGLEPSNCGNIFGRAAARGDSELPILEAGESVEYDISLTVERHQGSESR